MTLMSAEVTAQVAQRTRVMREIRERADGGEGASMGCVRMFGVVRGLFS